jgi:hypothetical protein
MIKILTLLALIVLPNTSFAKETGELIPAHIINVSLIHHSYMEADQFGILMKVPNAVSGCYDVSNLEFETSFIEGNYMDIKVHGFRRTPVKTKNVAFGCDISTKVISAMIPISANDLRNRGIRQIRFDNGNIEDNYDVKVSENSITLTPERNSLVFKAMDSQNGKLIHSFDGAGIVALHVPMANKSDDIEQIVRNFAHKNALSLTDKKALKNNVFYFMDESGKTLSRLGDVGYVELGTISTLRPYNEGQGLRRLSVPLKVFATRPGTTL